MNLLRKNIWIKGLEENMDNTINVTQKLLKLVKHRKTPLIVDKQKNGYNKNRQVSRSLSYESYSFDSND